MKKNLIIIGISIISVIIIGLFIRTMFLNVKPSESESKLDAEMDSGTIIDIPNDESLGIEITDADAYYEDNATIISVTDAKSSKTVQAEKDIICDLYPDFVYMFQKWNFRSKREVMDKLIIWLEHKELELVLQAGFEYVGMNKNFWRLTEENRRATCLFMRQNPQFKNLTLQELRQAMKADSPKEYGEYLMAVPSYHRSTNNRAWYPAISYQDYKYLLKVQKKTKKPKGLTNSMWFNELMGEYQDYMHMLYRSEHDSHDEYWLYPSDLHAFHEKLVEEERLKREAEELARQLKREEEMRKKQALLKAISKKYKGLDKIVDGYSIFITSDFEEWKRQAEKLHQCIVAAGYYQKMADQKSTIVFIQKDGEPMATAEISQAGKILQFYANELDRNDCKPSEEIQTAFNKWLDNIPKTKWKPRKIKEAA